MDAERRLPFSDDAIRARFTARCGKPFRPDLVRYEQDQLTLQGTLADVTALAAHSPGRASGVPGLSESELETLVPRMQRPIFRLLLARLGDAEQADALTQECFLRAFRARHRFRGDCAPEGWLLRIAANLAHDHQKSRAQRFWRRLLRLDAPRSENDDESGPQATLRDPAPSAEQELLRGESLSRLRQIAAGLPARQREVFHLRFAEEMPLDEIAATLGLALGSVKSHLARAVGTLRRELAD
jgi:RNA polymerase sigma-70 factor (ECF subfamily)